MKPEFGPVGLKLAVEAVNRTFPDILASDWRTYVHETFLLNSHQQQSLDRIPTHEMRQIQEFFAQAARHVGHGGRLHAQIVKLPPEDELQKRCMSYMWMSKQGKELPNQGKALV
jgi:hypothetical protein